jgi:hypothetical protein
MLAIYGVAREQNKRPSRVARRIAAVVTIAYELRRIDGCWAYEAP